MRISRNKMALYGNLHTVKMRRRHGLFTAEGAKAVEDLSRYFQIDALILREGTEVASELRVEAPAVYEVTEGEMKKLSEFTTPSDVMGVFRIPEQSVPEPDSSKLYVMLDGVRDPGNLGTIIRTCHWFGVFDIYASYDTVDCYNPKVVQATMGSLGAVRVSYCNLKELIESHRDMPVYGTLLNGDNLFEAHPEPRGFIVMGNEGKGITEELKQMLTQAYTIPPATCNHGESLNVAIATAIVLARITNQ